MHQLDRARGREDLLLRRAEHRSDRQSEDRPKPLTGEEDRVTDRLVELRWVGSARGEARLDLTLDALASRDQVVLQRFAHAAESSHGFLRPARRPGPR